MRSCSKQKIDVVVASDGAWTVPPQLKKLCVSEQLSVVPLKDITSMVSHS